jgi:hypothetical protein
LETTGIKKTEERGEYRLIIFVRHGTKHETVDLTVELNGMKTDLLFLALAEIYRELLFLD